MRFKRGMTLAETLLVFIVMGIIASMTIISVKPWEKTYKHIYSRIYNALGIMIYNDMVEQGKFPESSVDFCKTILKYMNTSDHKQDIFCTTDHDVGPNPNFTEIDDNGDAVLYNRDNFIHLSNGSIIWYAGDTTNSTCGTDSLQPCPFSYKMYNGEDLIGSINFYLVFADLNGDKKPNSSNFAANSDADIVAFAVTDKYTIVPLGLPQVDMKYLQAHFAYPSENDEEEDVVSDPMTYRAAQVLAFGTGSPKVEEEDGEKKCPANTYNNVGEYTPNETDCQTIEYTPNPMTIDLQTVRALGWLKADNAEYNDNDVLISLNTNSDYCNSNFCVYWAGDIKDKIIRTYKDLAGNVHQDSVNTLRINENCKREGDDVEPVCYVKIYDYH